MGNATGELSRIVQTLAVLAVPSDDGAVMCGQALGEVSGDRRSLASSMPENDHRRLTGCVWKST